MSTETIIRAVLALSPALVAGAILSGCGSAALNKQSGEVVGAIVIHNAEDLTIVASGRFPGVSECQQALSAAITKRVGEIGKPEGVQVGVLCVPESQVTDVVL